MGRHEGGGGREGEVGGVREGEGEEAEAQALRKRGGGGRGEGGSTA